MKIGFHTASFLTNNGYGLVGYHVVREMQAMGIQVPFQDTTAPALLQFTQPHNWIEWGEGQYRIGYAPWESSEFPPGWVEAINETDEFWTTSDLCKQWYEEAGVKVPIHIYHHGIDHDLWRPALRRPSKRIKFLHNGGRAPRKGGQQAFDAFRAAFGDKDDVEFVIKTIGYTNIRSTMPGLGIQKPTIHKNVTLHRNDMPWDELPGFYRENHVMVMNSWAEGFGLPGLEGMATGMPTILNPTWAPYRHHAIDELKLDTKVIESPWQHIHPGKIYQSDFDDLVDKYRYVYENIDDLCRKAYEQAPKVHAEFDWPRLTKERFQPVLDKINPK